MVMSSVIEFYDGLEPRKLSCLPREARVGSLCNVLSDRFELLPQSLWKPISFLHAVLYYFDQNGVGICNCTAAVGALQLARVISGQPFVLLSPGDLYGRINRGVDQGSLLGDAVRELHEKGVCTAATVPILDWKSRSGKAAEERPLYRIDEWYDCPTWDHICTAIQLGFVVDFGVMVGSNSFKPDRDGFVHTAPGRRESVGGHAMLAVGMVYMDGEWWIEVVNSWSQKWGKNGVCYLPRRYFSGDFEDAWAVRCATFAIA